MRTERQYVQWARRFILFHGKRHPAEMGAREVEAFLTHLAVAGKVAAATQNQALSALLFLYREVLGQDLPWLDEVVRAKRPARLPVVLTRREVAQVLERMERTHGLMTRLPYGTGMRLMECVRLRVKDVDLERGEILVRDGKGAKDRVTMLPESLVEPLKAHLKVRRRIYEKDGEKGMASVYLPDALARKYPNAVTDWGWHMFSWPEAVPSTRVAIQSGDITWMKSCCNGR
jgi:integron integrase